MRGVGAEKAAAVRAQILNRRLTGRGPHGNRLRVTRQGRHRRIVTVRLNDALRHEKNSQKKRQRQQQPQRNMREIDPEIADAIREFLRKPAHHHKRRRNAGSRGRESRNRQTHSLRKVGERRFPGIVLPVGAGNKGDCDIESRQRGNTFHPPGIQREQSLTAQEEVEHHDAHGIKEKERNGVLRPSLRQRRYAESL